MSHGFSNHQIYDTWRGMIGRCKHKTNRYYHNYGGRGIRACDEWQDAATFIKWALDNGWSEGLQIDRVDNDGDYRPGNCRFVNRKTNCRNARHNRFIAIGDVTKTLAEWCDETGINKATLRNRLARGWTTEQALALPLQKGRKP